MRIMQTVDPAAVLTPFAQEVSQLADGTDEELTACLDTDMHDCARLLRAARRVARMNYQAKEQTNGGR